MRAEGLPGSCRLDGPGGKSLRPRTPLRAAPQAWGWGRPPASLPFLLKASSHLWSRAVGFEVPYARHHFTRAAKPHETGRSLGEQGGTLGSTVPRAHGLHWPRERGRGGRADRRGCGNDTIGLLCRNQDPFLFQELDVRESDPLFPPIRESKVPYNLRITTLASK